MDITPQVPKPTYYLATVLGMTLIGVAAIVTVFVVDPQGDHTAVIVSILGFIAPTTAAIMAFLKSQETHQMVNGRMDEFMRRMQVAAEASIVSARAEGLKAGTETGTAAANARTDKLAAETPASR
jgi:hypothetical protein